MTTREPAAARLLGLILAGGRSRRLGRDKALLRRDGKSQLQNLADVIAPLTDAVYVSTRADQRDEPERSRFAQIVDRYTDIGPLAGILSAMDEHPDADWLVVACDLPNVDDEALRYLVDNATTRQPFAAYRSSHDGLPEPLCAIYRAGSDAMIREFVADGVHCPRKIMIRSDTLLLEQPNPAALDNVNTPGDLDRSRLEARQ